MHSATCSIKFTVSDWCTALHNDCLRSIDWLGGVIFLPRLAVVFLPNDCLSSYCVYNVFPKYLYAEKSDQKWSKVTRSGQKWPKVTKSGQKWPEFSEDLRNPSFRWERITKKCVKNAFIACGIVDKDGSYDVYYSVFIFPDFPVWNRFGMVILVSWLINCVKTKFWTVLDRFGPGMMYCTGGSWNRPLKTWRSSNMSRVKYE